MVWEDLNHRFNESQTNGRIMRQLLTPGKTKKLGNRGKEIIVHDLAEEHTIFVVKIIKILNVNLAKQDLTVLVEWGGKRYIRKYNHSNISQ